MTIRKNRVLLLALAVAVLLLAILVLAMLFASSGPAGYETPAPYNGPPANPAKATDNPVNPPKTDNPPKADNPAKTTHPAAPPT